MENDQFRKKVYMQTLTSTLINNKPALIPKWISQNRINYASSYEFSTYNIDSETIDIIPREQNQSQIIIADFKRDNSDSHSQFYYLYQQKGSFILVHQMQNEKQKILIYQKDLQQKSAIIQKFLDYIIKNQDQPLFSNQSLINKTQLLIQQIKQNQEQNQQLQECQFDVQKITQMVIVYECNFSLMIVQMRKANGILLVNMTKAGQQKQNNYKCSVTVMDANRIQPELDEEQSVSSRIIYIFAQRIKQIHKTIDITQFILLTEHHLLLIKANFELMQLCILHKVKTRGPIGSKITSIKTNRFNQQQEYFVGLVETNKQKVSLKNIKQKKKQNLKLYKIQQRKIIQLNKNSQYQNCIKYANHEIKTLRFFDDESLRTLNVKFSDNIVQSRYQLSQQEIKQGKDNIIMNVFNSMLDAQQKTQQQIIEQKQRQRQKLKENNSRNEKYKNKLQPQRVIKQIGGLYSNKNLIIIWQKCEPFIHICKIVNSKQLQERAHNNKDSSINRTTQRILQKERQMKEIYQQLTGNPILKKQEIILNFQSRIQYIKGIDLGFKTSKITGITLSPSNYNMLIAVGGLQSTQTSFYYIFQLQLFMQITSSDPSMFIKPFKEIHKNKSTQHISNSLVREMPIYLSGNLVHTSDFQLMQGALSFDIHPYHIFLAVSFGFTTKIYALQGNQKLSSLHTISLQGIKQVKYSPKGNHLCLLSSKFIKIIDSYSFQLCFTINEKNSNFLRCYFSTNQFQFFTISENNCIGVYNTFDYSRQQYIKPHPQTDCKPLSIFSYAKYAHYCIALQNGSLLVKYKNSAVVVAHEVIYKYLDNQKISCIQVDQKNGVLFIGCQSGKLRAHIWPLKQQQYFDHFSEIRIGFTSIQSLSLSNLRPNLYVGCHDGNTSKVRFLIDRERGNMIDYAPLIAQGHLKYIGVNGNDNLEKSYKWVLANSSSINQEIPEKLRLQYKLSQVIGRLNEQMIKLKAEIREQLEQKRKFSQGKFDINLYHHMSKLITTKLSSQLAQQHSSSMKQIEQLRLSNRLALQHIVEEQNQLMKQKSLLVSSNVSARNKIKQQYADQFSKFVQKQQKLLLRLKNKVQQAEKSNVPDQTIYHLPSCPYDFDEEYAKLNSELQFENKNYYQLRKQCAYKQTAIRDMGTKKIKQQSLQFKFELQTDQMQKKQSYNQNIMNNLKQKIQEAEDKVHQMQNQATIIKNNAQFKKIANLQEMNDACSYKIWVKQKTQQQIADLAAHLHMIEECLEQKSAEMVDLVLRKYNKLGQVNKLQKNARQKKQKLKVAKLALLTSRDKAKKIAQKSKYPQIKQNIQSSRQGISRTHSSAELAQNDKDVSLFNRIMQKQVSYLKNTVKIHRRKVNNLGKQNGELLNQFQKLKYQNKSLREEQQYQSKTLRKMKREIQNQQSCGKYIKNIDFQLSKTPFQKYLQTKQKGQYYSNYKTASNTPSHLMTPPNLD